MIVMRGTELRRWRAGWIVVGVTLAAVSSGLSDGDPVAERVFEQLQRARREAGTEELRRRTDLDRAALQRAKTIAAMPHGRRLTHDQPAGDALREAGIRWFSAAAVHLDMVRGYTRPEIGFMRSWQNYETAWDRAMSNDYASIGLATHRAEDGWVILVAVFVEELVFPEDLREVELQLIRAVNEVRAAHDLGRLAELPELSAVARDHSEEMAARDYLGHVNAKGLGPPERVNTAGIAFEKLGENVSLNRGHRDPVASAVEQWLGSRGHRESVLDPAFETTGVGVAIDEDGVFYFTQLYMLGSPRR